MDYRTINQDLWNKKTEVHYTSDFYDVDGFKEGEDSLNSIELALLGDLTGKAILHLQCHFGLDTISLARHGAIPTGVDFAEQAIKKARRLNAETRTNATFIHSDVYDLPQVLDQQFDMVFTSYGVLGWLPDMRRWAEVVHHFLRPGGRLVLVEFHPVVWMFDSGFQRITYPYDSPEPIVEEEEGTYAEPDVPLKATSVGWNHGLATVLNALMTTGLVLGDIQEYSYSPYDCFDNTVQVGERTYQVKGLEDKIPMLYSVVMEKSLS